MDKEETKVDILRVDESGITIIAGSGDTSTTVEAKINNQTIGKSQVNKDGEFVITGEVSSSDQPQELKIITIEEKEEKTKKIVSKEPLENEEDWDHSTLDKAEIINSSKNAVQCSVEFNRRYKNKQSYASAVSIFTSTKKDGKWGLQLRTMIPSSGNVTLAGAKTKWFKLVPFRA